MRTRNFESIEEERYFINVEKMVLMVLMKGRE